MGSANNSDSDQEFVHNQTRTNRDRHDRGSITGGDTLLLSFILLSVVTVVAYIPYKLIVEEHLNAVLSELTPVFRAVSGITPLHVAAGLSVAFLIGFLVIRCCSEKSARNWLIYTYHSRIYPLYRIPIRFSFVSFVIAIVLSTLGARILYPNIATQTIPLLYASIIVWKEVFFSGIPVIEITNREPADDQADGYKTAFTVANVGSADVTNPKLSYRLFNQKVNHFGVIDNPLDEPGSLDAGAQVEFTVEILDDSTREKFSGTCDFVVHVTDGYGYALLGGTTCWTDSIGT